MILHCRRMEDTGSSLSARCVAAEYEIRIPVEELQGKTAEAKDPEGFLSQDSIKVFKRVKKKKEKKEVEIRDKIHTLEISVVDDKLIMYTKLDAGSASNLSPEHLLEAFFRFHDLDIPRETVEVSRVRLLFDE